jgi:hypothetical protein
MLSDNFHWSEEEFFAIYNFLTDEMDWLTELPTNNDILQYIPQEKAAQELFWSYYYLQEPPQSSILQAMIKVLSVVLGKAK